MKSDVAIVGELSQQVNLGICTDVIFTALKRRNIEIKRAKEQLKKDLWWNLPLTQSDTDVQRQIDSLVDKAFPTED